ncbi:MAG: hypothetical protein OXF68_09960 [Gammaproteobacteria bacterium]|nr:hypothetical protein [Gammaproteobacteria bacterium]
MAVGHGKDLNCGYENSRIDPRDSFERTERLAPQQGRSRSEVDANAPDEHIAHHGGDRVTAAMNQACSKVEENNDAFLTAAGRRVLDNTEWQF